MYRKALFILSIFLIYSCGTTKSSSMINDIKAKTESVAKNNFKGDYDISYSKGYDFAAVTEKQEIKNEKFGEYRLKTMVYSVKDSKIIWGNKAVDGKLKWISKNELSIEYKTRDGAPATLIYNAESKKVEHKQ